jgi:outer membrane autotransporter protein
MLRGGRVTRLGKQVVSHAPRTGLAIGVVLGMAAGFTVSAVTPALADCLVNGSPAAAGTAGADVVVCSATNSPGDAGIDAAGGNDEISLISGTWKGRIAGGAGNDSITLDGATLINLDPGDTNNLDGRINGAGGSDTIRLLSGTADWAAGNSGDDTIYLEGATITRTVAGNDGNDTVYWSSGTLRRFSGGDNSDTLRITAKEYDSTQEIFGGNAQTDRSGFDFLYFEGVQAPALNSQVSGWQQINIIGKSVVGLTTETGATLGNIFVEAGSTLVATNGLSLPATNVPAPAGSLVNAGTVDISGSTAGTVLALGRDYTGGGELLVAVAGDQSDRMTVGGDVLGPATLIVPTVIASGSTGVPIDVVTVSGNTKAGDFVSDGFDVGAYSYGLELSGKTWQFVTKDMSEGATLYPGVEAMLGAFDRETVSTRFQRTGSWARSMATGAAASADDGVTTLAGGAEDSKGRVWLRAIGQWSTGEGTLKGAPSKFGNQDVSYDRDMGGVQGGVDAILARTSAYIVTAGLFGQTGKISADARNDTQNSSAGSADIDAWGLGGSLSLDTATYYIEAVGGWNHYDISTDSKSGSTDTNGEGYFLSIEAGHDIALTQSVKLVPQAQLAWMGNSVDSFQDALGANVSYDGDPAFTGRLGLAVDVATATVSDQPLHLTAILNYWYDFGDAPKTSVGDVELEIDQFNGALEAGAGFYWGTDDAPLHLHAEVSYLGIASSNGEQALRATGGIRIAF